MSGKLTLVVKRFDTGEQHSKSGMIVWVTLKGWLKC